MVMHRSRPSPSCLNLALAALSLGLLLALSLPAAAAAAAAAAAEDNDGAASPLEFNVVVDTAELDKPWSEETEFGGVLKGEKVVRGCHVPRAKRFVLDGMVTDQEVEVLRSMVERGMAGRDSSGGPTILDLNSGFCKDGNGLVNIYEGPERVKFTKEEYSVYRGMFEKIRNKIMEVNGLDTLYFTAPTFVARTVGNKNWTPKELHDEYWHSHIDKENTFHYDYSGLVYLSEHGVDFEGGEFLFLDKDGPKAVLPRRGRFITFASGRENPHLFRKVTSGTRYAFSMWFTCDKTKVFKTFLDGEAHQTILETQRDEL